MRARGTFSVTKEVFDYAAVRGCQSSVVESDPDLDQVYQLISDET